MTASKECDRGPGHPLDAQAPVTHVFTFGQEVTNTGRNCHPAMPCIAGTAGRPVRSVYFFPCDIEYSWVEVSGTRFPPGQKFVILQF